MLKWAIIFFIISLVAGIFGFTSVSTAAAGIAKIIFIVFAVLFIATLIAFLIVGKSIKDKFDKK